MRVLLTSLLAAGIGAAAPPCAAFDASSRPFKLTLGDYRYGGHDGQDLNLRYQQGDSHAWVGDYRERGFGNQWRAGFDSSVSIGGPFSLQPSAQVAQGGFVGGSLNLQVGDTWFGLVGIGRTNLKPYFNLNFDPNDAYTLGAGHKGERGDQIALTLIADNRLHTGQRDWHLTGRWPVGDDMRLSIDLLRKSGLADDGPVTEAWGCSITWDFASWFLRVAYDPKQNFSAQDATRFAAGLRF
jgi:hypothetical protein